MHGGLCSNVIGTRCRSLLHAAVSYYCYNVHSFLSSWTMLQTKQNLDNEGNTLYLDIFPQLAHTLY